MSRRPRKDGDEQDAFSRFGKRYMIWRAGERKGIKARANRRERRQAGERLRSADAD